MTGDGDDDPPRPTGRYQKGRSGNPDGRPKGSFREPPFEALFAQEIKFRDAQGTRTVAAEQAFLLKVRELAMSGNNAANRALERIRDASEVHRENEEPVRHILDRGVDDPNSLNEALIPLKMAVKLDASRETARMVIESWLVEAALARLGERRLSRDEQEIVLKATRTPRKVRWPDWWEVLPD